MTIVRVAPPRFPLIAATVDTENESVLSILRAAECCFYGSGYAAASMREIAETANVSKSLLHYHFSSKEHLFLEMQTLVYNRLAERIRAAMQRDAHSPEEGLRMLDTFIQILREHVEMPVHVELWARALMNDKLKRHVILLRDFLTDALVATAERIFSANREDLPINVGVAADLLWAALTGMALMEAFDPNPQRVENAFAGLREMVVLALNSGESHGNS